MAESRRRYELTSTLGEGGFGTVYLARLHSGGGFTNTVALKSIRADSADDAAEFGTRLRDEARMLGMIRHRAVVQVDSLVRLAGRWTVVMEYVDGVDLRLVPRVHGPLPIGPVLEIIAEVAGALHVAYHTKGPEGRPLRLLHRDIKPANLVVTPAGEVKVLDFGVARADFEEREAQTRAVRFGSSGYLAPERLVGRDSPAGDVYSLGVVAVELLTAKRYGQVASDEQKQAAQVAQKLASIGAITPDEQVRQLLFDMLGWDPDARPAAREVERRATAVRSVFPRSGAGEPLRDWAERELPAIRDRVRARGPVPTGELVGRTLTEETLDTTTLTAPRSVPPGTPRPADPNAATMLRKRPSGHITQPGGYSASGPVAVATSPVVVAAGVMVAAGIALLVGVVLIAAVLGVVAGLAQ
jgi:serine/threonine protein kinase